MERLTLEKAMRKYASYVRLSRNDLTWHVRMLEPCTGVWVEKGSGGYVAAQHLRAHILAGLVLRATGPHSAATWKRYTECPTRLGMSARRLVRMSLETKHETSKSLFPREVENL